MTNTMVLQTPQWVTIPSLSLPNPWLSLDSTLSLPFQVQRLGWGEWDGTLLIFLNHANFYINCEYCKYLCFATTSLSWSGIKKTYNNTSGKGRKVGYSPLLTAPKPPSVYVAEIRTRIARARQEREPLISYTKEKSQCNNLQHIQMRLWDFQTCGGGVVVVISFSTLYDPKYLNFVVLYLLICSNYRYIFIWENYHCVQRL